MAVWTAALLASFLAAVRDDSLLAMWWLVALRGLRRGEACGLRWAELDLDAGLLFVVRKISLPELPLYVRSTIGEEGSRSSIHHVDTF